MYNLFLLRTPLVMGGASSHRGKKKEANRMTAKQAKWGTISPMNIAVCIQNAPNRRTNITARTVEMIE